MVERPYTRSLAMLPIIGLAWMGAAAEEPPSEQEFFAPVPIVLTASRLRQPITEVPVTMTVIDRATIEASGLRSIAEVLRLVPGMYVRPGLGIEGVVPVVSYHGMTSEFSRRMQVLIDGRSAYLPPFATVLWDDLPISIDDVERIEVTRGPNAASDGANAFFGTINIITRAPVAGEGAYGLARAGQRGEREGELRYTGGLESASYRVTAGRRADDGFVNLYDAQAHDYATGRADVELSRQDTLQLQLGYSGGWRQQGFETSPVNRPRSKGVDDEYGQARWQRALAQDQELSLQYYYERHSVRESDLTLPIPLPAPPPQAYYLTADYRFDRHAFELQHTLAPAAGLRVVWGAGAQIDQVDAPIYFNGRTNVSSNLERLFAHAEWHATTSVLLQAGGMLERTSIAGTDLSPRVSATYLLGNDQSLRASVSGATRTPSLFESQGDFGLTFGTQRYVVQASGGNLQSERIISSEIGYHGSPWGIALQLDVKCYRDHASRMIDEYSDATLVNNLNQYTLLKNLDDAHATGVETEVHWNAGSATHVLLSYAYTVISTVPAPGTPGVYRTMPRNLLSALGQHDFGDGWGASLALYLDGGLPAQAAAPGQSGQSAVGFERRLDARLSRRVRLAGAHVKAALGVEDALADFVEFRSNTTFTRRAYLEVSASP